MGDIALLRAAGALITATPRGYIARLRRGRGGLRRTVACIHSRPEGMERELNIMVDNGCTVLDVVIEHAVYGQLTGQLLLAKPPRRSRSSWSRIAAPSGASPLSALTGGVHLAHAALPG